MPNALVVVLCAVAAASFWTVLGFAPARRLVGPALALPIAPALGWAVHSAAALPILLLAGFSTTTVAIVSAAALAASVVALLTQRSRPESPPSPSVPVWGYLGAAVLALAAAMAIMPKVGIDGIAFAPPIFDHSKVAMIDEMTRLGLPPGNPFFGEVGEPRRDWPTTTSVISAPPSSRSSREQRLGSRYRDDVVHGVLVAHADARIGELVQRPRDGAAVGAAAQRRPVMPRGARRPFRNRGRAPGAHAGDRLWRLAVSGGVGTAALSRRRRVVLGLFFLGRLAASAVLVFVTLVLLAVAGYESSTWIGGVLFPAAAAMAGGMLLIEARRAGA